MRKLAALAMVLLLFAHTALAQINGAHPRLILDSTTLTTLRARANANTPQWQKLKSYCDSFIGGTVDSPTINNVDNIDNDYPDLPDIGQGYQGSSYWSALLAEGLCYQVISGIDPTAAAPYGQKARDILITMATTYKASGSNGQDPCTDDGYGTRYYGVGMGIGYDWAYDALSSADRTAIYTTANAWLASFADPAGCSGFEYANPVGNYFSGYFHADAVIAIGTFGDNPNAPALWTDWQNNQFSTAASNPPHIGVQPYYTTHMTGGGWPEGFGNYGPLATLNMSLPTLEVSTSVGTDLIHAAAPYTFPVDAGDYLMHFTWPSRNYIDDRDTNHSNGDDQAPPPGSADPSMFMQVLGTLRFWNAPHADAFQQYANEVIAAAASSAEPWEEFLFYDPNGTTAPLSTLPLSYFATGLNAVAARSDWTTSASWMSFRAAPYIDNPGAGEEGFDQGGLALVRGATPLLVNGTGWAVHEPGGDDDENRVYTDEYGDSDGSIYSSNRTIYNVYYVRKMSGQTVVDRYGQAAYTAEDDGAQTHVAAYEDGGSYVLTLATQLEDMYRPDPTSNPQVAVWSREIVYLRPNRFVVYDRTTSGNAADDQFLAFHFPANPVAVTAPANEERFDVTYESTYAGAMTTILPANATTTVIGMYPTNDGVAGSDPVKVWQVQVRPPDTNVSQKWLTAFDLSPSAAGVATATPITVTSGAAVGSLLATSGANEAILFNSGAAGSTIAGTVGYTVPAVATTHFVTELPASAGYTVTVTVSGGNHLVSAVPVGPLSTSAKGVLTFTVSAAGVVGPGDRIFANGFQ